MSGPVARPAYMQTGVYARSVDEYAAGGRYSCIWFPSFGGNFGTSELASGSERKMNTGGSSGGGCRSGGNSAGSEEADTGRKPEEPEAKRKMPEAKRKGLEVCAGWGDTDSTGRGIERKGIDAEIIFGGYGPQNHTIIN